MATKMPTRRHPVWLAGLAVVFATTAVLFQALPALAATNAQREEVLVNKINNERAERGLRPVRMVYELRMVARQQSNRMVAAQDLFHNPELAIDVTGWMRLCENVAYGGSIRSIHTNLMESPGHRANILNPYVTQVGVGVRVDRDGRLWVTEVFRQPL